MEYRVVIMEHGTNKGVKAYKWTTNRREAEKIDDGVNINFNHEQYYTIIEQRDNEEEREQIAEGDYRYYNTR